MLKIALIHDHLVQDGGAEKVLDVLAEIFPQAVIYTLLYDKKKVEKRFKDRQIEASIIQKLPFGVKRYKWYLGLMPMAVEFFDLREFDLVISDTSSFAKGVITLPEIPHICYCHTPTRYLWSDTHQYINELKYNKYLKKIISMVLNRLRIWDFVAASRVDYFIANSNTVKNRIKKYYRRSSEVIYPPVDVNKFYVSNLGQQKEEEKYFLAGCRLAPYKRIDLLIEAFLELGYPYKLKIFGDGIDLKRLKKLAKGVSNIEFLSRVNSKQLANLYSNCQAYLNPQEEDFGITMVEAMASGRPVIAFRRGGALEIIEENLSGLFFDKQNKESVIKIIKEFKEKTNSGQYKWDSNNIRVSALKFKTENFRQAIKEFIIKKTKIKL
jgi:glycosyltransferase involved in cell wall biosynthesis